MGLNIQLGGALIGPQGEPGAGAADLAVDHTWAGANIFNQGIVLGPDENGHYWTLTADTDGRLTTTLYTAGAYADNFLSEDGLSSFGSEDGSYYFAQEV
jgi:hypothetical protein